ncbi:MAG: nicotinate (nicotinamide) nucleotide adenylyltransferase [Ruminococcus sp.]|nr:nicotinate (nicotinamide) nucleotide adenylyltransferase [Ruminococcus sp.]
MGRTGLFGGTFNPVHNGHIHLAKEAFLSLGLERLILIPSNIPPHKNAEELCSNEDRLAMCRLAAEEHGFEVSDYEMRRGGKSYSFYTVGYFSKLYPDDELFLLVGSDMFLSFDKWFRFEDILKKVTLSVISRQDDDTELLKKKAGELQIYGSTEVVDVPAYPVSSTQIRNMIKTNENFSCYLPEKVVQYIRLKNLYK